MTRFCANCGTEVDDTAIFCPTCGQPIDQEVEAAIPPAPAWPSPADPDHAAADPAGAPTRPLEPAWGEPPAVEPRPAQAPAELARDESTWDESTRDEPPGAAPPPAAEAPAIRPVSERTYASEPADVPEPRDRGAWDQPAPAEAREVAPPTASAAQAPAPTSVPPPQPAPPPSSGADRPASPAFDLPITRPVTLSAWLIGIGATLAAIGALISLFDGVRAVVDLLVLVAMAAVAVSVFFSSRLPAFGHLRLATLAIVLVAFGAATDRILAGVGGPGELLLFLGAAAAVIGAVLLETGRDQPLGGS